MYGFVNGAWRNGHTTTLEFIYDESGRPVQLIWNDGHSDYRQVFNYVLNLQGDVVQLRQASDGAVVATYLYNAWGEILSSSGWMAGHNPLRYRGKYYDQALGMYYLQSRYYDPAIGRFINADAFLSTGQGLLGYNMFAYCLNNPVNRIDPTGYFSMGAANHRWPWNPPPQPVPPAQCRNPGPTKNALERGWKVGAPTDPHQAHQRSNTSPAAVINSMDIYGFAYYRGAPVRHPLGIFGPMAIFGTIWLPEGEDRVRVVSHEWGHLVDERHLGTVTYFFKVGVPSVLSVLWDNLWGTRNHGTRSFEVRANENAANYSELPLWPHQRGWQWDWQGPGCR